MYGSIGKSIAAALYVHKSALCLLAPEHLEIVRMALSLCPDAADAANVYKIDINNRFVSLLNYPHFFDDPFPELLSSWRVFLEDRKTSYRTYKDSLNPPILHRKELLIAPDHFRRNEYVELTTQAEQIGLFKDTSSIGFKNQWEEKIRRAGFCLVGHQLQPLGNDISDVNEDESSCGTIQRYRTALSRTGLSAPIQALARANFLDSKFSYFDYGCGRGDDIRALKELGFNARGWDPHFRPNEPQITADIVNLGFVINVIEDFDERTTALKRAFTLAQKLLIVSVMLYTSNRPSGRPFRDGYLTQRNTFQKYFTQQELKEFVENALGTEAIPVAPGIVFIFSDKEAEQAFLYGRERNRHSLRVISYRRQATTQPKKIRISRDEQLRAEHGELLQALWQRALELGRDPVEDEFEQTDAIISIFGSWLKGLRWTRQNNSEQEFSVTVAQRREDLIVYLALQIFARRSPYRSLHVALQRDIKFHFGTYQHAHAIAKQHLADVADVEALNTACVAAHAKGLGYYIPSDYIQLHASLVEQLPALLRIYIGCGALLYGDLQQIDLIKIHIRSSKLSLMRFDDFVGKPLPLLLERAKITLRSQSIDFFEYGGEYGTPPLYYKSRYINEEHESYPAQLAFDEALAAQQLVDADSYGPSETALMAQLNARRLEIGNFRLQAATSLPILDDACGENFSFRQLIECGETFEKSSVDNVPLQAATYNALYELAIKILDPVIEYFGMIRPTYGFSSAALARTIPGRIAPKLDQHSSCELNRSGNLICQRQGAAVDFIVDDENMTDVAIWIASNLPFDRLYYYGSTRPIHVSIGPENSRLISVMTNYEDSGRRMPRSMSAEAFIKYAKI